MKTTTRGLYALKAMLALAAESTKDNPVALHKIADKEEISAEFLQQIFFRLRKSGLISAYRGPGGGFYLNRDKSQISVLEVLEAAGESLELSPCAALKTGGRTTCEKFLSCSAGKFWTELEREMKRHAAGKSLQDLLDS